MSEAEGAARDQVMIVGPDGRPVGTVRLPAEGGGTAAVNEVSDAVGTDDAGAEGPDDPGEDREDLSAAVEEPAKVMRVGTMIKQLLEEVRATELDDASRRRLREIHATSLAELESALSSPLRDELARVIEPFTADATPTDGELRVAHAQLVGWLEGLFHGIQTALVAQQMAARVQLEGMRRGLPAGRGGVVDGSSGPTTGQYL